MIDAASPIPGYARGPVPPAAVAAQLAAEQRRVAVLVAIRQRYAEVGDGEVLLAAAVIGGWDAARLEEELQVAAGEVADPSPWRETRQLPAGYQPVRRAVSVRTEAAPVCFAGEPVATEAGPGKLFSRGPAVEDPARVP